MTGHIRFSMTNRLLVSHGAEALCFVLCGLRIEIDSLSSMVRPIAIYRTKSTYHHVRVPFLRIGGRGGLVLYGKFCTIYCVVLCGLRIEIDLSWIHDEDHFDLRDQINISSCMCLVRMD